jgi:hypothetical protein
MCLRFHFLRAFYLMIGAAQVLIVTTALAQETASQAFIEPRATIGSQAAIEAQQTGPQQATVNLQATTSGANQYLATEQSKQPDQSAPVLTPPTPSTRSAESATGAIAQRRDTHQQNHSSRNQCADPIINSYRKSIAFASFPRLIPASSSAGALYQVDQLLPRLLGDNLRNRHATLTPIHLSEGLYSADHNSEVQAAAQAQALAKKHRTQFIVSGEVQDMSMAFPGTAYTPGLYTRFMNGVHNTLHINTPLDKRDRIFAFHLQLRDGFTGQILFDNHYQTLGKWKAVRPAEIGFGSPRFWKSDYGRQIQQLVTKASDELAATIHCQPYIARVETRQGQQQVIIRSGANNGLRAGDALELYQLVVQQTTGEYHFFDTRLVRLNTAMLLTEVYPSHSVAQVSDEIFLNGQYLALAP